MKGLGWLSEFKAFALKGNMIDLAVAVIIGMAFGNVVQSIVKDLFMPILSFITPEKSYESWVIAGKIRIGAFIGETINFLVVAMAVFIVIVKVLGSLQKLRAKEEAPKEPTTKECPRCLSSIPIKATKCCNCTADL